LVIFRKRGFSKIAGRSRGVLPNVTLFSASGLDLIDVKAEAVSPLDFHLTEAEATTEEEVEEAEEANLKPVGDSSSVDLSSRTDVSPRIPGGNIAPNLLLCAAGS